MRRSHSAALGIIGPSSNATSVEAGQRTTGVLGEEPAASAPVSSVALRCPVTLATFELYGSASHPHRVAAALMAEVGHATPVHF
jgi:hypothetical protein